MERPRARYNVREESGMGDMHTRTCMYWEHLFLQVRNGDASGLLMPPLGEMFFLYQHFDPKDNPPYWPETGPGDPEGTNVTSPMCGFVFGNDAANYPGEESRINDNFPFWLDSGPPATPEQVWELGKLQRGAMDPDTGEQGSVALEAARSAQQLAYSNRWPHRMGYGGYFPLPLELLSDCGATESLGLGIPS